MSEQEVFITKVKMKPFRGLNPVETAFQLTAVPLAADGTVSSTVGQELKKIVTPPGHVYLLTFRFLSDGGTAPACEQIAETEGDMTTVPQNAKRAIEIGVVRATANDPRSYNNFKTVDVRCFPWIWKWGQNPK